ncbi:MAG TPA: class I SAM-dependent methyltransferase [Steroidobacteraceae bacterium]
MADPLALAPAFMAVIRDYEARAQREDALMASLPEAELMRRRDELLLSVGRSAGIFLNLLIKEARATRILEVGSSYGYSTHWLAEGACAVDGHVTSLELKADKAAYAAAQLRTAGLAGRVEFRIGDALASLKELAGPFDLVLIDLWKNLYVPVWELLQGKLAPGALVVADNMIFPESAQPEVRAYRERVRATAGVTSVLLSVGNGLELSRYR